MNPFEIQAEVPTGWKKGEPIEVTHVGGIVMRRKHANPFNDPPGIAASLKFESAEKANQWLRGWFA